LESPTSILEELRKTRLTGVARDLLRRVTIHHRIQGSIGIEKALVEVEEFMSSMGYEVKFFEFPASSRHGYIETPVSWDVYEGRVEIKVGRGQVYTYHHSEHPTLVSAHSPPSEGCGKLTWCKDLSKCEGEVVLVEAPGYLAYKESSARLIVLYDSKRYSEAVPYTGLFIGDNEIEPKSVVNIPYSLALKIISQISKGYEVEVCWSVKTAFSSKQQKGLIVYRGEDPGILYISHICHPKPGAHDNASGVVSNILTAMLLDASSQKVPHAHLFVPEYSGTIFAYKHLPWTPIGVVNLDMVGSKQWITNSTLNLVIPPLYVKSRLSPYLLLATKLVLDEASSFGGFKLPSQRYSITPYTAGSDHDVTLMWGVDSIMLNEWPSKYYHTDMDDVDSISPAQLYNTGLIAALVGILSYTGNRFDEIEKSYKGYIKSWFAIEGLKYGLDLSTLASILDSQIEPSYQPGSTPISSKFLYRRLGRAKYEKLRSIKGGLTFLSVYGPLALRLGIKNPLELFQLENMVSWSFEEKQLISNAWRELVEEMGFKEGSQDASYYS